MALTRATKQKRLDSLKAEVEALQATAKRHRERAQAAQDKAGSLAAELEWMKTAPVSDPLPEEGGAE